jgi:hypothetical protein
MSDEARGQKSEKQRENEGTHVWVKKREKASDVSDRRLKIITTTRVPGAFYNPTFM